MEIACVLDSRLGSPARPGLSGGLRPGRHFLPDPVEAAERTEAMVRRLEAIGAAVESERAGEAFFAVAGLGGIHGGDSAGLLATARAALEGPPPRSGRGPSRRGRAAAGSSPPTGSPLRIGTAPSRFAAFAAAWKRVVVPADRLHVFLAPISVAILPLRLGAAGGGARGGGGAPGRRRGVRPRSWSSPWNGSASTPCRSSLGSHPTGSPTASGRSASGPGASP